MKYKILWILFAFSLIKGSESDNPFTRMLKSVFRIIVYNDNRPQVCEHLKYEIPCGKSFASQDKIVGGKDAAAGEFPWLVSIQVYMESKDEYDHNCCGSIINSKWVLTAAHCVYDIPDDKQRIVAGVINLKQETGNEQYRKIKKVVYSGYNNKDYENDIALVELDEPFDLDPEYAAPLCIPYKDNQFKSTGVAAGWGRLQYEGELPDVVQKVELNITDISVCRHIYTKAQYDNYLHECQMCTEPTEGKDTCQGDSGGPLMCLTEDGKTHYACGIASWGLRCATEKYPGMYTSVECFTDWITKNVQGTC